MGLQRTIYAVFSNENICIQMMCFRFVLLVIRYPQIGFILLSTQIFSFPLLLRLTLQRGQKKPSPSPCETVVYWVGICPSVTMGVILLPYLSSCGRNGALIYFPETLSAAFLTYSLYKQYLSVLYSLQWYPKLSVRKRCKEGIKKRT